MNIIKIIFWIALLLFIFPYIFYPVIIKLLSLLKKDKKLKNYYHSISMIIPAYNEKNIISKKIENCLSLNYPKDKVEILLGSDGSNDGTNEVIEKICLVNPKIKFYNFKQRRGKISVLNDLSEKANNEILIFSDANCMLNKDCLINIDKHFSDKKVGCVSGVKRIIKLKNNLTSKNEGLYWKFESFIKKCESKFYSLIGADGAILAIKKNLYNKQDSDTVLDDFMISINVLLKYKKRVVYETNAIAYEKSEGDYKKEYIRKVRIASGAFQSIKKLGLINPFSYCGLGLIFHKMLRWLSPIFIIICTITNLIVLLDKYSVIYFIIMILQISMYLLFYIGYLKLKNNKHCNKLVSTIFYFSLTILAQLIGFLRYINNKQKVTWEKENR